MRKIVMTILEFGRYTANDEYGTDSSDGLMGAFFVTAGNTRLKILSSGPATEEFPWEHVSVSAPNRTPTWEEMTYVKHLFWTDDECVIQFHPPKKVYVNHHPFVLHLWKSPHPIELPPTELIGPKT